MSKATVTIVEDEIIIARELAARLTGMGYDVADIAGTKQEAVRRVEEHRPDVVFMDIVLRGEGDGIEAAEEIRRRFNIPVFYVTAYADSGTLERAKAAEPFGYILKHSDKDGIPAARIAQSIRLAVAVTFRPAGSVITEFDISRHSGIFHAGQPLPDGGLICRNEVRYKLIA